MTPAEELRQAAKLMRERAQTALGEYPAPWTVRARGGAPVQLWVEDDNAHHIVGGYRTALAHIAGMHPAVALAVADWLDAEAGSHEVWESANFELALAVARAYLGTGEAQ